MIFSFFRLLYLLFQTRPTTFFFFYKYIQYSVLKRIPLNRHFDTDQLHVIFNVDLRGLALENQKKTKQKQKQKKNAFKASVLHAVLMRTQSQILFEFVLPVRLEVRRVCRTLFCCCYCIAVWIFFRIVLCNSFPAMLLNRFIVSCLFFLLTISAIDVNSYSSIKQYRDALIARLLLKSWRKKMEEQRVRFFDRLPQSVESRYTTVNSTNAMA
jgi:hypothetical protein